MAEFAHEVTKSRLNDRECTDCLACIEVCPVDATSEVRT